jgi:GT2 family glycosyltransferase
MGGAVMASKDAGAAVRPSVSIVFLVYNRRKELRESLQRMRADDSYDPDRIDFIVVDNASEDGASEMVASEFPDVRLITRDVNVGVSGWNDGFAVAQGDWVLALDDDCYLPPGGLAEAMSAAQEHEADLVSFGVTRPDDLDYRFNETDYKTGLLSFWGCAVLMRQDVLQELGGYDPGIFVWANELEFMLRFFDAGFRHLHLPELVAVHMKVPEGTWRDHYSSRAYRVNARHWAYIAAKLLRQRDSFEALIARLGHHVRDAIRIDRRALKAVIPTLKGYLHGLRNREPVRNPEISRIYRRNFHSFASPWWFSRPLLDVITRTPGPGRHDDYLVERARYYPDRASTLQF